MTARLVIASFNGTPSIYIDHMGAKREPRLERIHQTAELTDEEVALGLTAVRQRWVHGALFHPVRSVKQ